MLYKIFYSFIQNLKISSVVKAFGQNLNKPVMKAVKEASVHELVKGKKG